MAGGGDRGAPYWAAIRLSGWLVDPARWNELDGHATARGVDVGSLDARRFLNLAYALSVEGLDDDKRRAFDENLVSEPVVVSSRVKPGGRLPAPGEIAGIEQMMALMAMPHA